MGSVQLPAGLPKGLLGGLNFEFGNFYFAPSHIQAIAIVFLVFLTFLVLARMRRIYVGWSLGSAGSMIFIGFVATLIIEGFLLIGGRTIFTELLGWKNPPEPVAGVLDKGKAKLGDVIGADVEVEIPTSQAMSSLNADSFFSSFQSLPAEEAEKVKSLICEP